MKKVKIGNLEYDRIENMFDINDERFVVFKQYLLQVFESIDKPLFLASYSRYVSFHNSGQHADGLIEWHNFKKAIELKELSYDAYSFCFALLHLEKDEDQRTTSSDFHLRKLEKMRSQGLSRGEVEGVVENFINAFPEQFAVYLKMLELMKPQLLEEALKD